MTLKTWFWLLVGGAFVFVFMLGVGGGLGDAPPPYHGLRLTPR